MPDQPPSSVVVVGASAGGVQALKTIAAGLPPDLRAPVAIVLHVSPRSESRLPQILSRAGPLPALHAEDGEPLYAGRIYIAPPDRHLLVHDGRCSVVRAAILAGGVDEVLPVDQIARAVIKFAKVAA